MQPFFHLWGFYILKKNVVVDVSDIAISKSSFLSFKQK